LMEKIHARVDSIKDGKDGNDGRDGQSSFWYSSHMEMMIASDTKPHSYISTLVIKIHSNECTCYIASHVYAYHLA
jgi:hypothetical protein